MTKVIKNYWAIFTIAGVIVALDQWTKWLVRTNIPPGQSWLPDSLAWLSPYARIVHWYNRGAAFGMFQEGSMVFTVLAFIVIPVNASQVDVRRGSVMLVAHVFGVRMWNRGQLSGNVAQGDQQRK